jgi:hypothetical protein
VTDSVSASVAIPLTIKVTAPPNLLNTGEIVSDGLVLNFEAGNSQSILSMSDTTTGYVWKDLSGRKNNAATDKNAASGYNGVACTAPTYSNDFGGIVKFKSGSTNCFYTDYSGSELEKSYTVEAWFRLDSTLPNWAAVVAQSFTSDPQPISIAIGSMGDSKMYVGYYDGSGAGGWRYCATAHTPTIGKWTHIAGTYGVIGGANRALTTYVDGQQICTVDWNGDFGSRVNTSGILIGKGHSGGTATFPGAIAAVRIYKVPLTSAQILQNFNATKSRFDTVNQTQIKPAQKYGVKSVESFTVTSGGDTKTVAIASGSRVGLAWDTATVANQVSFTLGDSLTVGTYSDTITVTDNLGASTFVPMTFTITQADTLTVYYETPTALSYTGNKAIINPPLRVTGLSGLESGTATATLKFKPAGTSCATGGTCVVGDIGPGGGIVFIVPSGSNTKYYEAAPANWTGTDDLASVAKYCSNTNSNALATTNWGIGWGETNTTVAKTLCGTNDAIAILNSFNASNNTGYSNWFIPAGDELAALATVRDQAGLLRLGSNWTTGTYGYWTSTEYTNTQKSLVTGDGSWVIGATDKTDTTHNMIRPVRSFTPCWAVDTCTAFLTTDTPTAAGRYALVPSNLAVGAGSLSNYVAVTYATTSVTINKINQTPQQIPWYNLTYPATMTINLGGGSGSGAIKYSVTDGFTNPGCSLDYKKLSTSKLGVCNLTVVKAADRNYNTDTATAVIWFVQIENNQPTNQVGSGTTIALNGINTLTIADTVTVQAPSITSITITSGPIGTLISIKGSGFSGATVKFYRNVAAVITSNDGSEIRVTVPSGARTGPIIVSTPNGQAASSVFTVL